MNDSLSALREDLLRAGGRIWSLNTQARRRALHHLAFFGPNALADLLPNGLAVSGDYSTDVVGWYVRWVGSHIDRGERPEFDLSDDAMCDDGPRVLLVSPVYRLNQTSIGLVRIAFFLRGLGIRADWVAATPEKLEMILQWAFQTKYQVIGHGTTHYTFHEDMRFLIRMAEVSPESRFLLGGHGAVFENTMLRQVLTKTPISYVVRGFGERSTARLAIAQDPTGFGSALPPRDIRGIYLIHEGEVLSTGIDIYNNLEFRVLHAIFDGRLFPVENGVSRLITSTHCPFTCVFCSSRNFLGQSTKRLDPSDVLYIVSELKRNHPELQFVEFNDDDFSVGYRRKGCFRRGTEWLDKLCDVANSGVFDGLRTFCYTRADTITRETLVRLVKGMNLAKIGIGLEHINLDVLKAMRKGTRAQRVLDLIRQALELGLDTNFFVILFSKWETRSTLVELIDICSRLALEGANVVYNWGIQPLRGADVSKDPSNQYLSSQQNLGIFQFEQREKILPDDREMASWFQRMNEDQDVYFALQDELLSRVADLGNTSPLDVRSPWIQRVFRQHRNVNLSNTLANLVRFHSMFEYGRRFLDSKDSYFVEGASRTWGTVLAYVFNGPTCPHDGSASSIQRKIMFITEEVDSDWACEGDAKLAVELDVVRVGIRAPHHHMLKPDSRDHSEWALKAMPRWRKSIKDVDTSTESGAYAAAALNEIEGLLNGQPPQSETQVHLTPKAKNLDYIL